MWSFTRFLPICQVREPTRSQSEAGGHGRTGPGRGRPQRCAGTSMRPCWVKELDRAIGRSQRRGLRQPCSAGIASSYVASGPTRPSERGGRPAILAGSSVVPPGRDGPAPRRSRPRPSPRGAVVERVPPGASPRRPGVRLVHRGNGLAPHLLSAVRHRARVPQGARPRRHQEPGLGVGHPAGPEPGGGGAASGRSDPDPRPGLEVLRSLRRGLPDRGGESRQDADPGPEDERLRRAVGQDGTLGVSRPRVDPRPAPP